MARHKVTKRSAELNLTPMLDLVFQLIVFFLLVTNFSAAQLPELEAPDPETSQAYEAGNRERLIINVLPDEGTGRARGIRVGIANIEPGDYSELTRLIEEEQARYEDVEVDLRADASIEYGNVRPIMNAITAAGVGRINLVALLDRENNVSAPE
ncbi:MAG: biopolymer transporter ExbD [Phycisphaeraceae bacterium]